ncbi:MAG: nuclear transport factor 2 family protein [Kangiellaceae bacterium]|nr:nuclear transport factor 2 family protein [Kangiellaceae bacterium]
MRFLQATVIAVLLISNALASEKTDQAQIIDNIHSMWKAVESNNLKSYMKYIHPDYTLFGEGDAYLHRGKDKEAIDIGDYLGRVEGVRTFMHQPEVIVKGDTAWITYYWSDAGYLSGERFTSRGKSTRIFVKEKGQWLCIHSHFTEQS